MKHLDLFSGIGGFALAASWVWGHKHKVVSFCEQDGFCQKVLAKHWPDTPVNTDIHNLRGDEFGSVDLVSGGFPCQPYSVAGKQRGSEDDRALWPEMLRVIEEAKPRWVIGENVTGIISMELDKVLSDLESIGYETQAFVIPACAVNAPHRRDRVWILAHSESIRLQGLRFKRGSGEHSETHGASHEPAGAGSNGDTWVVANSNSTGLEKLDTSAISERQGLNTWIPFEAWSDWPAQSPVCGRDDGISNRVDRLKALGNAIVPQVAAVIMRGIKNIEA